jgi:putative chitinase
MITQQQLADCLGIKADRAAKWCDVLNSAMEAYQINTPKRVAAFLSQIGHESGRLQYTTELWGPTPAQRRYEGRADLGNIHPNDGSIFRGHGLIQVTGRANHRAAYIRLKTELGASVPNFEMKPEALALPKWAALSAADYWDANNLNVLADKGDCIGISSLVNTGKRTTAPAKINGLNERLQIYATCCKVLGV